MPWVHAVHPNDGFDHWHQVTCRNYSMTECSRIDHRDFRARVSMRSLGACSVSEISSKTRSTPLSFTRGPDEIRKGPRDDFMLWLALGGETALIQDGRSARLRPGDLLLHDQARPFTLAFGESSHAAMITIPRALLTTRLSKVEALVARPITSTTPMGALAGTLVRQFLRMDEDTSCVFGERLVASALDIWSTALEAEVGGTHLATPASQSRLARVQRYMRSKLDDEQVGLTEIAAAQNMSVSTLMRLFAAAGTTPMRWLWKERLSSCYRILADRRTDKISTVALAFGFSDPSHFSRAFKAEFGRSPNDVRDGVPDTRPGDVQCSAVNRLAAESSSKCD